MQFSRRTAQLLHEDHVATLGLLKTLEDLIAQAKRNPPDVRDDGTRKTLLQTASAIDHEVCDHFTFEEDEIFPRLAEMGETSIGEHLREEHLVILPIGMQVSTLAKQALEDGFGEQVWQQFKAQAGDLIERLQAHIYKEEMALVPLVEEALSAETDLELAGVYGGSA